LKGHIAIYVSLRLINAVSHILINILYNKMSYVINVNFEFRID